MTLSPEEFVYAALLLTAVSTACWHSYINVCNQVSKLHTQVELLHNNVRHLHHQVNHTRKSEVLRAVK